jgi:hypothetical protein
VGVSGRWKICVVKVSDTSVTPLNIVHNLIQKAGISVTQPDTEI